MMEEGRIKKERSDPAVAKAMAKFFASGWGGQR
jgi:hypothetical protein